MSGESYKVSEAAILTCPWHRDPFWGETRRPTEPSREERERLRLSACVVSRGVPALPPRWQCCTKSPSAAATRLRTGKASKGAFVNVCIDMLCVCVRGCGCGCGCVGVCVCFCFCATSKNTCTRHVHAYFWLSALTRAFNVREGLLAS